MLALGHRILGRPKYRLRKALPLFLQKTLAYVTFRNVRKLPLDCHVKLHLMTSSVLSWAPYFMTLNFSLSVEAGRAGCGPCTFLTVVDLYQSVCTLLA